MGDNFWKSGDYCQNDEWWLNFFGALCELNTAAQNLKDALRLSDAEKTATAITNLTTEITRDFWTPWRSFLLTCTARTCCEEIDGPDWMPGKPFVYGDFEGCNPRSTVKEKLKLAFERQSVSWLPRCDYDNPVFNDKGYNAIDQAMKAVNLCEGIASLGLSLSVTGKVEPEALQAGNRSDWTATFERMLSFLSFAIAEILKLDLIRCYSERLAMQNIEMDRPNKQDALQVADNPTRAIEPAPIVMDQVGPTLPESDKALTKMTKGQRPKSRVTPINQQEQADEAIAKLVKEISATVDGLAKEEIAAMALEAMSTQHRNNKEKNAPDIGNRNCFFWQLWKKGYKQTPTEIIWNGIQVTLREKLGYRRDVDKTTNTIKRGVRDHDKKLPDKQRIKP